LQRHLQQLKALRGKAGKAPPRLVELKGWQSERLARSYRDLAGKPRYRAATSFFLDDLYGTKDFSARDEAMMRVLPVMARMLPEAAMETATLAIEVEALSEDLDQRLAAALSPGPITEASYAQAYRETSTPAERTHQIELLVMVGQRLDTLVKRPMVARTLRLMRRPARMAGLAELQDFLERGFESFRAMGDAKEFLETLERRELDYLSRIFSGSAEPFSS